jgi:hypothetical protein
MHPELTYEPDMAEILRGHGELKVAARHIRGRARRGGARLRETSIT